MQEGCFVRNTCRSVSSSSSWSSSTSSPVFAATFFAGGRPLRSPSCWRWCETYFPSFPFFFSSFSSSWCPIFSLEKIELCFNKNSRRDVALCASALSIFLCRSATARSCSSRFRCLSAVSAFFCAFILRRSASSSGSISASISALRLRRVASNTARSSATRFRAPRSDGTSPSFAMRLFRLAVCSAYALASAAADSRLNRFRSSVSLA
mmetsp:Transcript_63202/g.186804  ORF Transcript_63202/g.186804 Transcript_63202/m.186804 type:complete len:208 (-) Transcript_63202:585-1208(-)